MAIIDKYLNNTFSLLQKINGKKSFVLKVGKTKKHAFNGRPAILNYQDNKYLFSTKTYIPTGSQTDKELDVNRETEVEFISNEYFLFTLGKHIIVNKISYPDFTNPKISNKRLKKQTDAEITSLSNQRKAFYKKDRYYRMILPLTKKVKLWGDFTGWAYNVDKKRTFETLMKLKINNKNFHFFVIQRDKKYFFVIDSIQKINLKDFLNISNSIILSYAFLKGDYHGSQAYIFSYSYKSFKKPTSIKSIILSGGFYNGFPIHSTSPHSLIYFKKSPKYKKDQNGKIVGIKDDLRKYMVEFPSENFSKLCELINSKGGILRSVILLVTNHSTTLEMKIPVLFVALENITKVLTRGDVITPKLIENGNIEKKIKNKIKKLVKEINQIKRENRQNGMTPQEEKAYNASFERVITKLYNFNNGTNNKKLIEPFSKLNYKLTEEEKDLILTKRNKFLHGDDFMSINVDYEFEFKELFHISLKLQKLISILLLKSSDYSGYILNNTKIYDYITEKNIKENVFIKI